MDVVSLELLFGDFVIAPLVFGGVWSTLDLLEAVLAELRRPKSHLLDTRYKLGPWGYAVGTDIVRLSSGAVVELAQDPSEAVGWLGPQLGTGQTSPSS